MSEAAAAPKTSMQRFLDAVERVGNMVPHPVVIFLILIGVVIVLSALLGVVGTAVTFEQINPETHKVETATTAMRSLLTIDGIRFMYSSLIPNFMSFTAVGLMIGAMIGAGVAEESGLVKALIRKLVLVSPAWALTYILAFVGIISSIAADAGYLVLIPLAGVAYMSVGRHPLAGLALGFAAVAGAFTVNMLIKPLDAVLVEFTNDAAHLVDPEQIDRPGVERLVLDCFGDISDSHHRVHHGPHRRAAAGPYDRPERRRADDRAGRRALARRNRAG